MEFFFFFLSFYFLFVESNSSGIKWIERAGALLTTDDDALGLAVAHHGVVGGIGNGKYVRGQLA